MASHALDVFEEKVGRKAEGANLRERIDDMHKYKYATDDTSVKLASIALALGCESSDMAQVVTAFEDTLGPVEGADEAARVDYMFGQATTDGWEGFGQGRKT